MRARARYSICSLPAGVSPTGGLAPSGDIEDYTACAARPRSGEEGGTVLSALPMTQNGGGPFMRGKRLNLRRLCELTC